MNENEAKNKTTSRGKPSKSKYNTNALIAHKYKILLKNGNAEIAAAGKTITAEYRNWK
jgi:hypothetical protein